MGERDNNWGGFIIGLPIIIVCHIFIGIVRGMKMWYWCCIYGMDSYTDQGPKLKKTWKKQECTKCGR